MVTTEKYLRKVILYSDVYVVCLQHALITEKEEVMGLLIGEVDEDESIAHIFASLILNRSDKQPDRVEISPEQLCYAAEYAEELSTKLERPMRVLGWYHSHPHITVWPSHVDLRTQASYQMMDPLFVGLIFSVYQTNRGSNSNHVQLTCFQAHRNGTEYERREIKVVVENSPLRNYNLESIASLPRILIQEEVESHKEEENAAIDYLAILHNDALKTAELVNIVANLGKPLYEDLDTRLKAAKVRRQELEKIKEALLEDEEMAEN